jgi:hypothetical protein
MEIWMNVVKYDNMEACIEKHIVPFAICMAKDDQRIRKVDEFINTYYGITMDARGYTCCICNVILADKCRSFGYTSIKNKDKTVQRIREFKPVKSKQLNGKVIVDICFDDGTSIDSIALVETIIENVEKGKLLVNKG